MISVSRQNASLAMTRPIRSCVGCPIKSWNSERLGLTTRVWRESLPAAVLNGYRPAPEHYVVWRVRSSRHTSRQAVLPAGCRRGSTALHQTDTFEAGQGELSSYRAWHEILPLHFPQHCPNRDRPGQHVGLTCKRYHFIAKIASVCLPLPELPGIATQKPQGNCLPPRAPGSRSRRESPEPPGCRNSNRARSLFSRLKTADNPHTVKGNVR